MSSKWHEFFAEHQSETTENGSGKSDSTKCYITIASDTPRGDFPIDDFFSGSYDSIYANEHDHKTVLPIFKSDCKIYENLGDLFANSNSLARGKTATGMYILVSPYSIGELEQAAAAGNFSKMIQSAYSFLEAKKNGGKEAIPQGRVAGLDNPHFIAKKSGPTPNQSS